jgi:hypothetical protein
MQILNYTPRINLKKKITKPKFFLEKQNRFGSVFWDKNRFKPVWLDFFGLDLVRFFRFQAYKTEIEPN